MTSVVPIDDLLPQVEKAARYIGGEVGSAFVPASLRRLHVGLCFPDIYEVAESHLGLKIIYDRLNSVDGVLAERVYAPWADMRAALQRSGRPLFGLETHSAAGDMDLLAFSINHELAYATVLAMLDLAGLPLRAEHRDRSHPIVLLAGAAMVHPEPLAPFADAIFVGEGEEAAIEIATVLRDTREQPRLDRLHRLARVEGVYLPGSHSPRFDDHGFVGWSQEHPPRVRARKLDGFDKSPPPTRQIVPHVKPVHDRLTIEIQRGCTQGCRFCQAGMIYRPTRQRAPADLCASAVDGLRRSGAEDVGLLSLSAGDYAALPALLDELGPATEAQRAAISLPSLRTETLSPDLARQVTRMRSGSFTLAPEAATDRLRQVIAKGNSEDDLMRAIAAAVEAGSTRVKLYFMIGLPTETDDDVVAIAALARRAQETARGIRRRAKVAVAVSTFVPKPHTPFQWEAQIDLDEVRRRQELLRQGLRGSRIELKMHDARMSTVEGLYARGDRRLAHVLERAYRDGAWLDGWGEHFDADRHLRALTDQGLEIGDFLAARDPQRPLPWDHVDLGLLKKFLLRERRLAYAERGQDDCIGDVCRACGVCDFATRNTVAQVQAGAHVHRVERPLGHRDNRELARLIQDQRVRAAPLDAERSLDDGDDATQSPAAPADTRPHPSRDADLRHGRLRLLYQKQGHAVHLSHLETMTALHRALRRLGLPLAYSGGFHAKPRISSAGALSVGLASDAELLDVDLREPYPAAEVCHLLNRHLPRGLAIVDALSIPVTGDSLGSALAGAIYRCPLQGPPAQLQLAVQRFVDAQRWPLQKTRKGKTREIDLRPLVERIELDGATCTLGLHQPDSGGVKPHEALEAIFGAAAKSAAEIRKIANLFSPHDGEPRP